MDTVELAKLFVKYSELKKELDEVSATIMNAVLEIGETQTIAGVTAKYYKPSAGTPDYESTAKAAMPDGFDLAEFSSVRTSVRWKDVCEKLGVTAPAGEMKQPRVVIR